MNPTEPAAGSPAPRAVAPPAGRWPTPGPRPRALTQRLLILGLDGATWTLLRPAIQRGLMPAFQALVEGGCHGTLHSTTPPITPAAWTTFLTGQSPGRHGIVDFVRYSPSSHQLTFNSTRAVGVRTLWQLLGEHGLRVASCWVPMCYPPYPVNGVMVSGFETPSIDVEFCYPPEFKPDLLARVPGYTYKADWQRCDDDDDETFVRNMNVVADSFDQAAEVLASACARCDPHVAMIVLKLIDNVSHKAWVFLDPASNANWPTRQQIADDLWRRLDAAIARMVARHRASDPQAAVMVMSDHGHGSLDRRIYANRILELGGFLQQHGQMSRWVTHVRDQLSRWTMRKGRFNRGLPTMDRDLACDWPKTAACVMHAEIDGFLYLNVKGQQPPSVACVDPGDVDGVRAAIRNYLLNYRDADNQPMFKAVHRTEELYDCPKANLNAYGGPLPDLVLVPPAGSVVVRKVRGGRIVRQGDAHRFGGTHRPEGVFVLNGWGIRPGAQTEAHIIDLTPTALAWLGLPVPHEMQGDVLDAAFTNPITAAELEPATLAPVGLAQLGQAPLNLAPSSASAVYSPEDEAELTRRLSDLGYLE